MSFTVDRRLRTLLCYVLALGCSFGVADAQRSTPLAAWIFTNGAVLQRERPVPVWGTDRSGQAITVTVSDAAGRVISTAKAVTNGEGKWEVQLPAMHPGGPFSLSITGDSTLTLTDILIGDVWVCSGQSNMTFKVSESTGGDRAIATSAIPKLHLLTLPMDGSNVPLSSVRGPGASWVEASPSTTPDFSAVAFYFGRELRKDPNVPIGLIHSSVGGTRVDWWTSHDELARTPEAQPILEQQDSAKKAFPAAFAAYRKALDAWYAASLDSDAANKPVPPPPWFPDDPRENYPPLWGWQSVAAPSRLYNAMIAPLLPYAIAGVVWYQGEFNTGQAYQYRGLLSALIASWRTGWGRPDLPFLIVQLPNLGTMLPKEPEGSTWAEMREAQYLTTRTVPNTGLAVTIDLGGDLHPPNKLTVGQRLARVARALVYQEKHIVSAGPMYTGMTVSGDTIRLHFDTGDRALTSRDSALKGFAIAGDDQKFVWANARIDGNDVLVWSANVSHPKAARYAWADNPPISLFNTAGLPAMPFRTDTWPGITVNNR